MSVEVEDKMLDKPETTSRPAPAVGDDVAKFRAAVISKLTYAVGKNPAAASDRDWFLATAFATRDRIVDRWITSTRQTYSEGRKRVYYLSLEFLIGRLLFDALTNLELLDTVRAALGDLGVDLDRLRQVEPDAALGNGGLGRLAACFMDSMATLSIAAYGYGIRYENGLFRQMIKNGWQQEFPEDWLSFGNPWEFERPEVTYDVGFGGSVESVPVGGERKKQIWHPAETVEAVAYDTPIVGWRGRHVNTLRLWSARAVDPLRLDAFNQGDHVGALVDQVKAEAISKVLYPSDATPAGQELRLRQEYFFTAASMNDLMRRHIDSFGDVRSLPDKVAIQLNDTHPSIAVAELMRVLLDEHDLEWDEAWDITVRTISYTNHTLLPEALETWPVPLMERVLPRHMQIIYLLNAKHLEKVRAEFPNDGELLSSVSLIQEDHGRRVRMGNLAFLGSHSINGVAALHSELMTTTVFKDFYRLFPERMNNKTNGITFRRWLYQSNPGLTNLLVDVCGPEVLDDASQLKKLEQFAADPSLHERLAAVRRQNKVALARVIRDRLDIKVNPGALFDVQIKRIHEYKRQLLNVLETIALYDAMRANPAKNWAPRVKIFSGKAAASYQMAKLIIKLANDVARVVNDDPTVRDLLKVVFLPNYNVSKAESIIPAADLSEQISTAGMEASGTGNMKMALNGALTIGTLDGANVEIKEHVGDDNIFIFGLTADEVEERRRTGIGEMEAIRASEHLGEVLDAVGSGVFSPDEPDRFKPLVDALRHHDYFLVTSDFDAYWDAQRKVDARWLDKAAWWTSSAINTSNMAFFSSDRTITEYATDIWHVPVRPVR
ncbi:glycogen/starch/alpha-glucan phosphorylase [Ancylobacter novellus DSM 506]|uniref:Alpha-1,4 glucan phosphorylase n=1 Tax=Ancylobacter novellus (strain ATCC 8093 / DSM 506 / JCM 20403 / CCM 1077 / IAM 12100 / NBRC 12443 / NCIMB 10456) TaxID=639283 RepID=D7A4J2_ANCN5|nr:glycogen/starch/alpha-glucan phosphorylase [Ancylobacter novellus]ADH89855.1 glycogen/starch/alpha-glucan phosphorylase [Ancylobacter novellus DSM 506]